MTQRSGALRVLPKDVATTWFGHSRPIAARHYLAVRDHHVSLVTGITKNEPTGTDEGTETATQNPTQHTTQTATLSPMATSCKASPDESKAFDPADVAQQNRTPCNSSQNAANGPGWIRTSALRIMSSLLYR